MRIYFFNHQMLRFFGLFITFCSALVLVRLLQKKRDLAKVTAHEEQLNCSECRLLFKTLLKDFSHGWIRNESHVHRLRGLLNSSVDGLHRAVLTQSNSPVGTSVSYYSIDRSRVIDEKLFNILPKSSPLSQKTLDSCAVVGNSGILANSSCGGSIDSAQFVIRCNAPPLEKWSRDVGEKTDLMRVDPYIIMNNFFELNRHRRPFVDSMKIYGNALLFLPLFSCNPCPHLSLRAYYSLEDFESPMKAIFLNPDYDRDLDHFWRRQGLSAGLKLSSGFTMVSLALELCRDVNVYGFWPFRNHPHGHQPLLQRYYDDAKPSHMFRMPAEFAFLVKLHQQGVLKLHLGRCPPEK